MENLTSGNITKKIVEKFLACLLEAKGDVRQAAILAEKHYDLNQAATPEMNDSFCEAVARYREAN